MLKQQFKILKEIIYKQMY